MSSFIDKVNHCKQKYTRIISPILKKPFTTLITLYIFKVFIVSSVNKIRIPERTSVSWSQMELVWLTRALSWDSLNLQICDTLTWMLLCNKNIVSLWSDKNIAHCLLWWWNISLDLLAWNKYILNSGIYPELLERKPDQGNIFRFRNGQIWEWHCPLYAMKSAIYATSLWSLDIDIDTLWKELWFDFETKTWYWKVRNMADLIQKYVTDCDLTTNWTFNPTLERLDESISCGWVAVVNILSQWWYMHRVTVLWEMDWKYIIMNSWRTMFDKNKKLMKSISPIEPFASYTIATWTLQLVSKVAFEYNMRHSFEQNFRSGLFKELSFWSMYSAAIFVERKQKEH